jgi:hypothetical protein
MKTWKKSKRKRMAFYWLGVILVLILVLTLPASRAGAAVYTPADTNRDGGSYGTDEMVDPDECGGCYETQFYFGCENDPSYMEFDAGWIFDTAIPQGATILTATLKVYNGSDNRGTVEGKIYGYDVDSPDDFNASDVERISDHHTRTTEYVQANPSGGSDFTSASLVDIIQEIVDRGGFSGKLGLTWRFDGSSCGSSRYWTAEETSAGSADSGGPDPAEFTVTWSAPASPLYRSVGNDSSDLNAVTGANVDITGTTAQFDADLPDNIGVGDVLEYQGVSRYVAFISGRIDANTFTVQDRTGGTPTATGGSVEVRIYRAHLELNDWEEQLLTGVNPSIHPDLDDLVLLDSTTLLP